MKLLLTVFLFFCTQILKNQAFAEFFVAKSMSSNAPVDLYNESSNSMRCCAFLCSTYFGCFGFYWLTGVCHLLSAQLYYDPNSWSLIIAQSDIFTRRSERLLFSSCKSSSVHPWYNSPCTKAMDGGRSQIFNDGSCVHTFTNSNEWWEGELPKRSTLLYVTIYNRLNSGRQNNFILLLDGVMCNQVNVTTPFSIANVTCVGQGTAVRLLNRLSEALDFCEFEAYGFC